VEKEKLEMKKWIGLTWAALIIMAIIVTGCSSKTNQASGNTSTAANPAPGKEIVLGLNFWPGYGPWFIAQEKGFFKKYGLNVNIRSFSTLSDQLSAVTSGQLDVTGITVNDLVLPVSKGIDLRAIGVYDYSNGGDALVVSKDIKTMADLKGKRLATEMGTVNHMLMLVGLEKAGLTGDDIKFTNMSMNDTGPALLTGKLDGASTTEPYIGQAISGGAKVLFSSADVPGLITDVMVIKGSLADKRPEDVKNLLNAWFDALDYWKQNPDESMKIMAKAASTPVEEYSKVYKGIKMFSLDESIPAFNKGNDYTSLYYTSNKMMDFLKGQGMMDKSETSPNLDKALDPSFLKKVQEERKKAK
jgi:NitT/TauT family transport system substrate-binding protein